MKNIFVKEDFSVSIDRKHVFHLLDCYEDNPVYEQMVEEYENRVEQAGRLIKPQAVFSFANCAKQLVDDMTCEESPAVYVIMTIGKEITAWSQQLFKENDVLAGMLVDAMADAYLFAMEEQLGEFIHRTCLEKKIGVSKRLEAPDTIPMQMQAKILEETTADALFGIKLTEGFMFNPVKTTGYILVTTKDASIYKGKHDCRNCMSADCMMRNVEPVQITCMEGTSTVSISCHENESILEAMRRTPKAYSFACGGRGTCGKCKIQVIKGKVAISPEDRSFFSEEELEAGYRLACKALPNEDCTVRFCQKEEDGFQVLSEFTTNQNKKQIIQNEDYEAAIAIDIGTTTLVVSLVNRMNGEIMAVYTTINRQRAYGLDVIARIQASCEGKKEELQKSIQQDLLAGIHNVINESRIAPGQIEKITITGNTTMGHLLMGYPCETLGKAPFTPVDIKMKRVDFKQVFHTDQYQIPISVLPGISTFVGADIAAGILHCGFIKSKKVSLLIDLGTNGEMAIGNQEKIYVTSTAAGPAFEGGNISCGIGSIAGAIFDIHIEGKKSNIKTIGDKPPIGICGTGSVAVAAELLREELVDETGLLEEEYFETGYILTEGNDGGPIAFLQTDVREIQLAKAAVRAGIETLMLRYGVSAGQIDTVYLAGGFGYQMDLEKAVRIGLLPEALQKKIKTVGNSALAGAIDAVLQEGAEKELEEICAVSEEINLSGDKDFNEFFMEYMMFEC